MMHIQHAKFIPCRRVFIEEDSSDLPIRYDLYTNTALDLFHGKPSSSESCVNASKRRASLDEGV